MSNSTQNDEIKQIEKAIDEGFVESEKAIKGMKTPFDKSSTQNNHEMHTACIERIKKEGASATCCHCNPHDGCTLEMKPTQNETYQKDAIVGIMEKVTRDHLPEASKTIKKDWAIEYIKMRTTNTSTISQEVDYIDTLLADARREAHELGRLESTEFEVDKARREVIEDLLVEIDKTAQGYASSDYVKGWSDLRTIVAERHRILATLKEETL